MPSALDLVLQNPAVWRGNDCAPVALPSVPTGYAEIDAWLPGGGWPAGALTEIHVERAGVGELQLVMPAAARLTRSGRWVTLVAPPYVPYAPAFAAHGVQLSRLLLVRATTTDDGLWACEQALRSQACGATLAWFDRIHERALRRLQLAAESGGSSMLLFRPARAAPASPAALRLYVSKSQSRTLVRILKRRGGGLPPPIALDLDERGRTGPFRINLPGKEAGGTGPFRTDLSGPSRSPRTPRLHDEPFSREMSGGKQASSGDNPLELPRVS